MDATHRGRLGDGPELAGIAAEARRGHVDGQVRQRPPEIIERDAIAGAEALIADVYRAIDDDIAGAEAKPGHAGVVADLEVERMCLGSIASRHEQQRIALLAELVADLLGTDRINGGLDLALRHARVE